MVGLLVTGTARADISPPGCSTDRTSLDIAKRANAINNGDTVTYTISFHNSADLTACDVTDAAITFTCPAVSGAATGTVFQLAGGASLTPAVNCPARSAAECFSATRDCEILVNPGVVTATVNSHEVGLLHGNGSVNDPNSADKNLSVNINTPTNTPTDTPTNTPTDTPTNTPTDMPTDTPKPTNTPTPTNPLTNTLTNSLTNTLTNLPINTPTNTPTAVQTGCRITGGGGLPGTNMVTSTNNAKTKVASFGGDVGAPCGCVGCFDNTGATQGEWKHYRKAGGNFHAGDYNSLECSCLNPGDILPGPTSSGGFSTPQGNLCDPPSAPDGPSPPDAPANAICFSGLGSFTPTNGKKTETVVFRVEAVDRGEPGSKPSDHYTMLIWRPADQAEQQTLLMQVCCTSQVPTGRDPDIVDGGAGALGDLTKGNILIYPEVPKSEEGICPPPNTACPASQ